MRGFTAKQLRSRNGGYGVHIRKVTDFRRKETVVCFQCSGAAYYVTRRFCSGWHCESCGEIRAIQIVAGYGQSSARKGRV